MRSIMGVQEQNEVSKMQEAENGQEELQVVENIIDMVG